MNIKILKSLHMCRAKLCKPFAVLGQMLSPSGKSSHLPRRPWTLRSSMRITAGNIWLTNQHGGRAGLYVFLLNLIYNLNGKPG